ncbi:ABC transporter permease [Persicitalea jodogahamensis]|uniref:ABC transporter permease n=1 Tax=Persicitalea jodogahamensis TaxID=402147 RepID=A0A8J3D516_9BACT|nr:ABC transporter permease [Persicitalea jodogahamensis]GHB75496.1 ABC transporter permease [Persicitalea jodogahamensis]
MRSSILSNYLKIAFRNLWRSRVFSAINIIGLSAGLTCCFLIMLFVRHELSYDQFQARYDRIYRIAYLPRFAGMGQPLALTPPPVAPLLAENFSEIETTARMFRSPATVAVERAGEIFKYDEERFFFADPAILDIFSFDFVQGSPRDALRDKFSVVLSEKVARRYFGEVNPLGKMISYEGKHPMKVMGVVRDFPDNSHIHPELLANFETMYATENEGAQENLPYNWVISHSITYVLLRPGRSPETVNARFPKFIKAHADAQVADGIEYRLEPMRDFYLRTNAQNTPESVGSLSILYVFLGIAGLTLLIACINFVNLSTARSLRRAKEVGVRKVLGSRRRQLIFQFLGESLLLSGLALLLALLLTILLLPTLNHLTDKHLDLSYFLNDRWLLLACMGITLLAGLLSGAYPAFVVAGFQPVATLKGNFLTGTANGNLVQKILLGVQFVASIALIAGTLIMAQQMDFLENRPLGFDQDFIITASVRNPKITNVFATSSDSSYQRLDTFREVLLQNPRIQAVTLSSQTPGNGSVRRNVIPEGRAAEDNLFVSVLAVDYNFTDTYQLKLRAGRSFSKQFMTDRTEAFLINEKAVQEFGWASPEASLGKSLNLEGKAGKVVGVLQDFHNQSLYAPISSVVLTVEPPQLTLISLKLHPQEMDATLQFIAKEWDRFFPEKSFDYAFLDQDLAQNYEREQRRSTLISYFAGLAILISCLGLYGLIMLVTQQRTREIGIRKVLGASVASVVLLLTRNFVGLVALALLVASPIAWYFMNQWLEGFAYRIDIAWWVFGVAGLLALGIALVTVSFQALKAGLMNPVKSLRSE